LTVALHFPARVLDILALAPADGSLAESPLGDQDCRNRDVPFKPMDWGNEAVQGLHLDFTRYKISRDNRVNRDKGALPGPFLPQYDRSAPVH
jgi:hypothetical protein